MTLYDFAKHQNPLGTQRFGASKEVEQIPYKTCRVLIISVPFSEKCTQQYQKSMAFLTES